MMPTVSVQKDFLMLAADKNIKRDKPWVIKGHLRNGST